MKAFNIILGVYAVFNSLYCIFWPEESVLGIGWIIAILLALWGISSIAEYFITKKSAKGLGANGGIGLGLGITAMVISIISMSSEVLGSVFTVVVILCLALGIIVLGVSELVKASGIKKEGGKSGGMTAAGVFHLLGGLFGLLSIAFMSESAPLAVGIMLLIVGLGEFSTVFGSNPDSEKSELW